MAWLREYAKLVWRIWWGLLIGGILTIVGIAGLILSARESWLVWTCLGLLLLVVAQALAARPLMRHSRQPQNIQVIHNHFAPGSNPSFSVPPTGIQSPREPPPDQEGT